MAKIKFQRKFATISDKIRDDAHIESERAYNFFHSKFSFNAYERIELEWVKASSYTSKLVGKRAIQLPFENCATSEACNALEFSAIIISVRLLLQTRKIDFSENKTKIAFFLYTIERIKYLIAKILKENLLFLLN